MAGPWEKYGATPAPAGDTPQGPWSKYQGLGASDGKESTVAGAAQAGIEHFGNAAALGYLPQIQAAIRPGMDSALDLVTGQDTTGKPKIQKALEAFELANPTSAIARIIKQGFMPDKGYIADRDENLKRIEQEGKDYPLSSAAGTVAGAVASGAALSGVAPLSAATRLGRIGQAAKGGAILGAISNPGDTEGEVGGLQLGDRATGTLKGAAVGAAAQGTLEAAGRGVKALASLPGKLQGKAEERAFKAAGAMLKDYRKAGDTGRIQEIGRFMLDNDMIKPGMAVADVAEKSSTVRNEIGDSLGKAYDKAAAALKGQNVPHANLDPKTLADEFMTEFSAAQKGVPGGGARIRSVQSVVDDLKDLPPDGGFTAVNKFRQSLDDLVFAHNKTMGTLPETKQGLAALRSWIDQRVDGAISAVDRATGGKVSQELPELNRQYGLASEVSKISSDQAFRQNANRFFSPSDYASGMGGAIVGAASGGDTLADRLKHAAVGASLGLANKAVRTYGTPLVSQALDKTGGALARLSGVGAAVTPALTAAERSPIALASAGTASRQGLEAAALPKVASAEPEQNRSPSQLRGEALWVNSGVQALKEHGAAISDDQAKELASTTKGKQLLIQASNLKPGSKAMDRLHEQIKTQLKGAK